MSAGKPQNIRPYLEHVYKWKDSSSVDSYYPGPLPLHETTTRARSSSSSDSNHEPSLILPELLLLDSSTDSDSESEELITSFEYFTAVVPNTHDTNNNGVCDDPTNGIFYIICR